MRVVRLMHSEEYGGMEGMKEWWEHLDEGKKKAFIKAKMDKKMKIVQAQLDFLKEIQKIFG
jgi:hypothetical protein